MKDQGLVTFPVYFELDPHLHKWEKQKLLKKFMDQVKLKFPVGWGVQTKKTPSKGGYGYFIEPHTNELNELS